MAWRAPPVFKGDFSFATGGVIIAHRCGGARENEQSSLFGPVFEMARDQLTVISDHLGIAEDERDWLLYPKRAIVVTCPVRMEDNRTQVFIGYRVQHHLALGPAKGGTRFAPNVDISEIAALAIWMSWKCALADLPGGSKTASRRLRALKPRAREPQPPLAEMIHVGPDGRDGAGYGRQRAGDGLALDTYSMYQGVTCRNRHRQARWLSVRWAARATGHGVAFLAFSCLDALGMPRQSDRNRSGLQQRWLPCSAWARGAGRQADRRQRSFRRLLRSQGFRHEGACRPRRTERPARWLFKRGDNRPARSPRATL